MTEEFSRHILRKSVAQICQLVGWNSIHSTPLEILTDLLQDYIQGIARLSVNYAFLYSQTEPNIDHLGLAFNDVGVSISELEEYVKFIDTTCVADVPVYPLPRESHLNMLKPGSREVVTRPVHIHEHLPPMHPELEDVMADEYSNTKDSQPPSEPPNPSDSPSSQSTPKAPVFKRPGDPISDQILKRQRPVLDDEIRPLREISSVMMTTSGFLSPAREGKLPEARTIHIPVEMDNDSEKRKTPEPQNQSQPPPPHKIIVTPPSPSAPSEIKFEKKKKIKSNESSKKIDKENKTKDESVLHSAPKEEEPKVKKLSSGGKKESSKLKALKNLKSGAVKGVAQTSGSVKSEKKKHKQHSNATFPPTVLPKPQINKAKSPKNEKRNLTSSFKEPTLFYPDEIFEEKLTSEPDKQKLNIFKKISKVKEEHDDHKHEHETKRISVDDTIEAVIQKGRHSSDSRKESQSDGFGDNYTYTSHSPFSYPHSDYPTASHTVSTPRTPDIPKISETKKKKKDKHKDKHDREKHSSKDKHIHSPKAARFYDEYIGQPKTPTADINEDDSLPYPVYNFPPGPGLVPPFSLIPQSPLVASLYPKTPPFLAGLSKQDISGLPPSLTITPINPYPSPTVSSASTPLPTTPTSAKLHSPVTYTTPSSLTSSADHSKANLDLSFSSSSSKLLSSSSPSPQKLLHKKEHSKDKKLKNKLKKKKNKKEKIKSKDKSERKKLKLEKKEKNKERSKLKKEKKEKKEKKKEKKEKKEKKKDKQLREGKIENSGPLPKITVKLMGGGSTSSQTPPPETSHRKIVIKPVVKKDHEPAFVPSVSETTAVRTKPSKSSKHGGAGSHIDDDIKSFSSSHISLPPPVPTYVPDPKLETEVKVWICPACRGPDDGSPMIACDSCDLWFHWTCVGIQEAPESDWYCQKCLIKHDELMEKKKKHKKKKQSV